jgi:hypothetical protein
MATSVWCPCFLVTGKGLFAVGWRVFAIQPSFCCDVPVSLVCYHSIGPELCDAVRKVMKRDV